MDWAQFAVQWLHVLGGIFWFGGQLMMNFGVIPALTRLPLERQREAGRALESFLPKVVTPVAIATIVLGILRGTLFGPIRSADALTTPYGLTWLVALLAAIATAFWGMRVIAPTAARLYENDEAWIPGPDGRPPEVARIQTERVIRLGMIELLGFFVIFTAMILMRFGL